MKKTIRVIRTYEVDVDAEYGDTEETLVAKGQEAVTDKTKHTETAVLLPNDEQTETPADDEPAAEDDN